MRPQHIVNVSGGKDSAACYLLAMERRDRTGVPFRAVTADTGHEAPETYEWIANLADRTGGPQVEIVRADFSEAIRRKALRIATFWPPRGWVGAVSDADLVKAVHACKATGNPFLDLCILKGRFPSTKRRFCTEELKHNPIEQQVYQPALTQGPVIAWHGERADESKSRALLPPWQRIRGFAHTKTIIRPILRWTAEEVFGLHRRHGLPPNPLYMKGMQRVGCFPCIMAGKGELAQIAKRHPEVIDQLEEMERIVALASKRGVSTFFAGDKTPEGARMAKIGVSGARDGASYPGAREVFRWARTSRGGRQFDMVADLDRTAPCSSQYNLCE